MPSLLHLVRHGAIVPPEDRRYFGRTDLPLTETGISQAKALQPHLRPAGIDLALCSPLTRARQTAELAGYPDPVVWEELREVDFGAWEGRTFDEIQASDPERVQLWHDDAPTFGFPGGETTSAFRQRIIRIAARLLALEQDRIVIFAHGGVVRTLICHFLGLPLDRYLLFSILPASIATIRLYGKQGVLNQLISATELAPRWATSS